MTDGHSLLRDATTKELRNDAATLRGHADVCRKYGVGDTPLARTYDRAAAICSLIAEGRESGAFQRAAEALEYWDETATQESIDAGFIRTLAGAP